MGPIGDLPGRAVLLEFWPLPAFALGAGADELKVLLHELRNPLAGLRGAAQLLARMTLAPEARELAELVIGEADRMAELLQSRTRPARALRAHNPHELLERLCVLLSAEAPGSGSNATTTRAFLPGSRTARRFSRRSSTSAATRSRPAPA